MEEPIYEYRNEGKTLVSLFLLVVAIAAVVVGANSGAPIYCYTPIGFALLFGAWWFMNNPNHGCRLTQETLELWSNKETTTLSLADVDHVSIKEWTDGPDDLSLNLKDGSKIELSYLNFGSSAEFRIALEKVGLISKTANGS